MVKLENDRGVEWSGWRMVELVNDRVLEWSSCGMVELWCGR